MSIDEEFSKLDGGHLEEGVVVGVIGVRGSTHLCKRLV